MIVDPAGKVLDESDASVASASESFDAPSFDVKASAAAAEAAGVTIRTVETLLESGGAVVLTVSGPDAQKLAGDVVGTGVGWQAPGVESSAIWGVTTTKG